jgi:hypothetical protein
MVLYLEHWSFWPTIHEAERGLLSAFEAENLVLANDDAIITGIFQISFVEALFVGCSNWCSVCSFGQAQVVSP